MSRYYLNPFKLKPVFMELTEKDENKLSSLLQSENITYDQLPDKDELCDLLRLLTHTDQCFGKFDVFNKWMLIKVPDADIRKRLVYVMKKPVTYCLRCKAVEHCSMHHISINELEKIWNQILIDKGCQFLKVLPEKETK